MSVSFLTPDWPAPGWVRALSTLRDGGVSAAPYASLNLGAHVGDAPAAIAVNRQRLRDAAGLPAEPQWLTQVHGTRVADLDTPPEDIATNAAVRAWAAGRAATAEAGAFVPTDLGKSTVTGGPAGGAGALAMGAVAGATMPADLAKSTVPGGPADAAMTRRPGRVCAILTADCLPVLITTESGDRVAAAHAGWRGLAGGVLEATVQALGVPAGTLLAWLGPAIGPRHFEIGAEVREELLRGDSGAGSAFSVNARGRYLADLNALARRRLARVGVTRVYGGGECTYTSKDRYFSHRRDGQTGRQASLIWLERPANR